jgi:hypothetical protein
MPLSKSLTRDKINRRHKNVDSFPFKHIKALQNNESCRYLPLSPCGRGRGEGYIPSSIFFHAFVVIVHNILDNKNKLAMHFFSSFPAFTRQLIFCLAACAQGGRSPRTKRKLLSCVCKIGENTALKAAY